MKRTHYTKGKSLCKMYFEDSEVRTNNMRDNGRRWKNCHTKSGLLIPQRDPICPYQHRILIRSLFVQPDQICYQTYFFLIHPFCWRLTCLLCTIIHIRKFASYMTYQHMIFLVSRYKVYPPRNTGKSHMPAGKIFIPIFI